MHEKICNNCGATFEAARSDAKYCTDVCRVERSRKQSELVELEFKIEKLKEKVLALVQAKNIKIVPIKAKINQNATPLNNVNTLLAYDDNELAMHFKREDLQRGDYKLIRGVAYAFFNEENNSTLVKDYRVQLKRNKLIYETNIRILNNQIKEIESAHEKEVKAIKKEIAQLELRLVPPKKGLYKTYSDRKRKKRRRSGSFQPDRRKPHRNSSRDNVKDLGGEDIQQMTFDTYQLPGELGQFLGELDRNKVAFALTGDSGSGKSYFSFELARLLLDEGMRVKYYSLEEGIGKLTQEKLSFYDIGNELRITGEATIEEIRKDARDYDALIIDSYSKIATDPKDFEQLRQRFPKTLFIVIFQKTTGKTIRGGSSIKYNSSATIDVSKENGERIATMEKGRYGTQGWIYSIDRGMIIKSH